MGYRFVIVTQIEENYGAHQWDGEGACPQYWKFKGGNEITLGEWDHAPTPEMMDRLLREWVPTSTEYWKQYVISSRLLNPGEETYDEQMEREMEEERAHWEKVQAAEAAEAQAQQVFDASDNDLLEHEANGERLRWEGKR